MEGLVFGNDGGGGRWVAYMDHEFEGLLALLWGDEFGFETFGVVADCALFPSVSAHYHHQEVLVPAAADTTCFVPPHAAATAAAAAIRINPGAFKQETHVTMHPSGGQSPGKSISQLSGGGASLPLTKWKPEVKDPPGSLRNESAHVATLPM